MAQTTGIQAALGPEAKVILGLSNLLWGSQASAATGLPDLTAS
jgi:hypothetical protein